MVSDLLSWYWWFTAVFLALVVNLLSAYLKPYLDSWLEGRNSARRLKAEAARQNEAVEASVIASDARLMLAAGFEELRNRVQCVLFYLAFFSFAALTVFSTQFTVLASGLASVAVIVFGCLALGALVLSNWAHRHAMEHASKLRRARLAVLRSLAKPSSAKEGE